MIKRIILIAVILFGMIQIAHARLNVMSLSEGLSDTTAAVGTACASPITFSYHFENSNNVLDGTPQGCSDGDLIGTETGVTYESSSPSPQDGTYSMLFDNTSDNIAFSVSSRDLVTEAQGNISVYFYLDTFVTDTLIWLVNSTGDDYISLQLKTNTDNELRSVYRANGGNWIDLITTDCNLATGTWVHAIVRWDSSDVDPNLLIDCNDGTTISSNTNPAAWAGEPNEFIIGGNLSISGNIDNIQVKNTYAD